MSTFKGAFALLLLTGLLLALSLSLFVPAALGHAEFENWANRSIRSPEPVGYNYNNSALCQACGWRGTGGVGNLGIGSGKVSNVYPMFIDDAMEKFNEDMNKSAQPSNETAGNASAEAPDAEPGNGTRISGDLDTGTCPTCELAALAEAGLVEPLTPTYLLAGGVISRGTTYGITLGRPLQHILNENPVEFGALYAKMYGLPLPDGDVIDIGIKSIGYEY
jgi:hypothetical protein